MKGIIGTVAFIIGLVLVIYGVHPIGNKTFDIHLAVGFCGWLMLLYSFYCFVPTYDCEMKEGHPES